MKAKGDRSIFENMGYSGNGLIFTVPKCPKCHRKKYVLFWANALQSRRVTPFGIPTSQNMTISGAEWGCGECKIWFRTPFESHIVLPNGRFKRV
ncbi:hypothetical protein LCGC14_2727750 [marine sediment metagenome]|uniref:Uncharacterized protein n=1 Tax=marine sediment metagenome TaxID=412755 RepID=A0A0F9BH90_9ZZZZ